MDQDKFKDQYGLNNEIANKWGVKTKDDDNYQRNEGANSEHDFIGTKVKRDNLI